MADNVFTGGFPVVPLSMAGTRRAVRGQPAANAADAAVAGGFGIPLAAPVAPPPSSAAPALAPVDMSATAPVGQRIEQAETYLKPYYLRSDEDIQEETRLQQEIVAAEGERLQAEQQLKQEQAQRRQDLLKKYGTDNAEALKAHNQRMASTPLPSFVPTQTSATDIAGIFGLMGVIGMSLGGKGQMSALGAMNAMTGMMSGWKQGRLDLYNQELKNFEKNYQAVLQQQANLEKDFEKVKALMKVDLEAASAEIDTIAAKYDNKVLAAVNRKNGAVAALKFIESRRQDTQKFGDKIAPLITADNRSMDAMRLEELRQKNRLELEDKRQKGRQAYATFKSGLEGKGGLKPPASVTDRYVVYSTLTDAANDAASTLRANPDLAKKLDQYRVQIAASENMGAAGYYALSPSIPADVRDFVLKISSMRDAYFLAVSGKAVTGSEQNRLRNTIPMPGDPAETLVTKLAGFEKTVNKMLETYRNLYPSLPNISNARNIDLRDVPLDPAAQDALNKDLEAGRVTKAPKTVDVDGLRQRAKQAIADGASAEGVKARFKEMTGRDL